MSGPDTAKRADGHDEAARVRVLTSVDDPWWRVLDAECLHPAINAESAVASLYVKGGK